MKKVYALFRGEYSDKELIGIYLNKDTAEKVINEKEEERYQKYLEQFEEFLKQEINFYGIPKELFYTITKDETVRRTVPVHKDIVNKTWQYSSDLKIQECDFIDCPDFLLDKIKE